MTDIGYDDIAEMPDVAALVEDIGEHGTCHVENAVVKGWMLGFAYIWHMISPDEKARLSGWVK